MGIDVFVVAVVLAWFLWRRNYAWASTAAVVVVAMGIGLLC